ncbi:hypothetical protein IC175_07235 [Clostridioides sp. ES-S-0123-01]|nr:hypothetical protein [Clostridioides sp. ES-S-0123-01]
MSIKEITKGLKDGTIINDTVKEDNKKEGTDKYEITAENEKISDSATTKLSTDEIDKGLKDGTIINDTVEK